MQSRHVSMRQRKPVKSMHLTAAACFVENIRTLTKMCEYPEFYNINTPKARKEHICCECWRKILIGERYERISGKWDGEVDSFATCDECSNFRLAIHRAGMELDDCGTAPLGMLFESISQSDFDEEKDFPFSEAPTRWLMQHHDKHLDELNLADGSLGENNRRHNNRILRHNHSYRLNYWQQKYFDNREYLKGKKVPR